MGRLILASHGGLADGMRSAAEMILGDDVEISAYSLSTWQTPDAIYAEVARELAQANGDCVIVCDIKGGSVHNRLLDLCTAPNVYLLTGMNLTMVLELCMLAPDHKNANAIPEILTAAKDNICCYASEVLKAMGNAKEEEDLW